MSHVRFFIFGFFILVVIFASVFKPEPTNQQILAQAADQYGYRHMGNQFTVPLNLVDVTQWTEDIHKNQIPTGITGADVYFDKEGHDRINGLTLSKLGGHGPISVPYELSIEETAAFVKKAADQMANPRKEPSSEQLAN